MSILKILPSAIDSTANYAFGTVTANGVDLGATVAAAFNAANTVSPLDSYARQTANAAFDYANTAITTAGGTITGNLTVNAFTANTITANGVDLGTAVASAFLLANSANKTTTSDTAPTDPKVGDIWYDTVMSVTLRYTNDGTSNNWIDISGPQNAGYIFQSYSISSNTTSLNETTSNTSVALTVSTINIADGTTLYWTISGSTGPDFTDGSNSGSVNITNNSGTITRTLTADVTTEGAESFIAQLRTGSISGPIVAIAPVITVADTSQSPAYKLYATGFNASGHLGLNDTVFRSSLSQVGSSIDWAEILTVGNSSHFIKTDGTLWGSGYNGYGQVGTNTTDGYLSPVQVGALTNWSKLGGGDDFVVALRTDGTLWTWGYNGQGQLGLGHTNMVSSPTQVGTNTNWVSVSVGIRSQHVLATDSSRYLYAWGNNNYGQLGTNNTTSKSSPVQVSQVAWWTGPITTGDLRTTAITVGGGGTQRSLYTWGYNALGQLGLNNAINRSSPVQVGTDLTWLTVSAGYNTTLATKTNGTLWVWGGNDYGQLGINNQQAWPNFKSSPIQVGSGTTWDKVSSGGFHSAATKTDGTLWTWGRNDYGQLGSDTTTNRSSPGQVGSATNWYKIAAGNMSLFVNTIN